jgi:hypothetical protein
MADTLLYNDNYFRYLFILMKYGADVKRRRIRATIFLFLEYKRVRFGIVNDKKKNRLLIFVYYKETAEQKLFEYLGEVRIYGYYPKQVRKILYNLQKKIRENAEYRERIIKSPVTISRKRGQNYKRWIKYSGSGQGKY